MTRLVQRQTGETDTQTHMRTQRKTECCSKTAEIDAKPDAFQGKKGNSELPFLPNNSFATCQSSLNYLTSNFRGHRPSQ